MTVLLSRRRALRAAATVTAFGLPLSLGGRARAARERIVVRLPRDIQNLDPINRSGYVEGNLLRACTQRLVGFARGEYKLVNDAAETITQVTPTVIDFTLKSGLTFHGGYGTVTADDVKFSYERFLAVGTDGKPPAYAKDWDALERVEVTGPLSGRIHLKRPAPALWLVALPGGSGSIVSRKAFETLGDKAATTLIGSGPYAVAEWRPNDRIVLRAHAGWTGTPVGFNEVVLKPVTAPKTAELAFRSDELAFTDIEPASAAEFAKFPGTRVISLDSINYVWVGLNVQRKPLDDLRVREALRKAIDVDQVVLAAYNGAVKPARALMAPGLLGHWADAPVYRRDVAGARALLDQAGVAKGTKLRLTLLNRPAFQTAGLVIKAQLAEVGIDLQLEVLDAGAFWSAGKGEQGQNLELSLQRFGGVPDPSFQTQWFVSDQIGRWNWQRWANPDFDRLDTAAGATEDVAERARLYVEGQKLMDRSAAFIWLTHEVNVFAAKTWLNPAVMPNGDDQQYHLYREA